MMNVFEKLRNIVLALKFEVKILQDNLFSENELEIFKHHETKTSSLTK
jgi:hypothetical protein